MEFGFVKMNYSKDVKRNFGVKILYRWAFRFSMEQFALEYIYIDYIPSNSNLSKKAHKPQTNLVSQALTTKTAN